MVGKWGKRKGFNQVMNMEYSFYIGLEKLKVCDKC